MYTGVSCTLILDAVACLTKKCLEETRPEPSSALQLSQILTAIVRCVIFWGSMGAVRVIP